MIVRIATEGQYEIAEEHIAELNMLDNDAVAACESADEQRFHERFERLLEFVRTKGRAVGDDHLGGSDLILPPPDVSLAEAREEFAGEGLLPG